MFYSEPLRPGTWPASGVQRHGPRGASSGGGRESGRAKLGPEKHFGVM